MSRKLKKREGDETEVNLTPMLDIVFIMLIFFIVTATFVREQGIDVSAPDPDEEQTTQQEQPIVIAVDPNNNIFVDEGGELRQVDVRAVRANVARKLAEFPKSPVLVQAAKTSDMGMVVRVMDQAKLARDPSPPVSIATTEG